MAQENHFFAEQELCNSRLNDRIVDSVRRKREPRAWNAKPKTQEVTDVVVKKGVVARVTTTSVSDDTDGLEVVATGAEHLVGYSAEERRRLLEARALPCVARTLRRRLR